MSRIITQSEALIKHDDKEISKKLRNRQGKNHVLEQAVFAELYEKHSAPVNLNGDMIREKAAKLQELKNAKLPSENRVMLIFFVWLAQQV